MREVRNECDEDVKKRGCPSKKLEDSSLKWSANCKRRRKNFKV
jgi:hypothetical protein